MVNHQSMAQQQQGSGYGGHESDGSPWDEPATTSETPRQLQQYLLSLASQQQHGGKASARRRGGSNVLYWGSGSTALTGSSKGYLLVLIGSQKSTLLSEIEQQPARRLRAPSVGKIRLHGESPAALNTDEA